MNSDTFSLDFQQIYGFDQEPENAQIIASLRLLMDSPISPESQSISPESGVVISENEEVLQILTNQSSRPTSSAKFLPTPKPVESSIGRPIKLLVNHFQVLCNEKIIRQYKFRTVPDLPSKKMNRKLLKIVENSMPELKDVNIVFDGWDTVYTTGRIDVEKVNKICVPMNGLMCSKSRLPNITVYFEFVDQFRLSTQVNSDKKCQMMHAMDTILRQSSCDQFNVVLQSFFSTSPQNFSGRMDNHGLGWGTVNLGVGREVCYGFYQTVVESADVFSLNIDVATTTFYRPIHMIEFLSEVLDIPYQTIVDGRVLSEANRKRFAKEVSGIKIETRHCENPRRYRVGWCTAKPAANIVLTIHSGEETIEMSLADYYKQRYNIQLKYSHLPCLEVGRTRDTFLPIELCYIVAGQRCIKKLNEQQIANLIKATSRNAQERKDAVLKIRDRVGIADDKYSKAYGVCVDQQMLKLEGKVLPAPKLLYCSPNHQKMECITEPNNGTWDMRGKNFYNGIEIRNWAVVCFANSALVSQQHLRQFVESLRKVAREIGMPFLNPPMFCKYASAEQASRILEFLQNDYPSLQLVVCVVPGKSSIYGDLKRKGDLIGLTTQCIRGQNVLKASAHTLSNLCMKINSKLGGVNLIIYPPQVKKGIEEPILYVGCHLSRNAIGTDSQSSSTLSTSESSICCLVGSIDGHPTRFSPVFRTQPKSLSIITEIREMMVDVIMNFYEATGFKPHRIVIYRSGVSDSNLVEILQYELRGIREACLSIDPAFQPGITLIGSDITHHTRLFAANDKDRMGNSTNVPAGTLVETGITVNDLFEFYLVSHAGIQGTSRPTKYTVMWDDNQFSGEEIHRMTYELCHTQSRCTRSVSIPSPIYYARLVAQRAKILMSDKNFNFEAYKEVSKCCDGMMFT